MCGAPARRCDGQTYLDRRARKLHMKAGAAVYAVRKAIVEQVLGQIKQQRDYVLLDAALLRQASALFRSQCRSRTAAGYCVFCDQVASSRAQTGAAGSRPPARCSTRCSRSGGSSGRPATRRCHPGVPRSKSSPRRCERRLTRRPDSSVGIYLFNNAGQFSTTVMAGRSPSLIGVLTRIRLPSALGTNSRR